MILPHNIEIEDQLLAALIMMPEKYESIIDLVADDFYKTENKKIFNSIRNLNIKKQPVDIVVIGDYLKKRKELDNKTGKHLLYLADNSQVSLNVYGYSKKVKDFSNVRSLCLTCMQILDKCDQIDEPDKVIEDAQDKILRLEPAGTRDVFKTTEDLMLDAVDRIEKAQVEKQNPGIDLNLGSLSDQMFVSGSKLVVIAARPGLGKTALMLAIAKRIALEGKKPGIISIEMDNEELADRMLSEDSDYNSLAFHNPGKLSNSNIERISDSASFLSSLPIVFNDAKANIQDIKRRSRKMAKDCDILMIDQLSKIRYPKNMTEYSGFTRNINELAELKKELRIPIVVLCQLGRKVEESTTKEPKLWHLKQTGAIEEDADVVLFIYRPGVYGLTDSMGQKISKSFTKILMPKVRGGIPGEDCSVLFNDKRGCFILPS